MKRKEACGIFGINCRESCFKHLEKGAFHIQSRGQKYGGFSVVVDNKLITETEPGLIKPIFEDKKTKNSNLLESNTGIAHVSLLDPQPVKIISQNFGPFSLALNGRIINRDELLRKLGNPPLFSGSDAEILAILVAKGKDCIDGIENIFRLAKGAYSLAVLTPEGIFAVRDPLGFKPLILGKNLEGCAFSSESPGLEKIGMQLIRDVRPGEIDVIEKQGFKTLKKFEGSRKALCPFEYSYFARESSLIEGIYIKDTRHNTGRALAENDDVEAHLVSPIPFSGNAHAEGYEIASSLSFISIFEYYRYSDRSWTPETQKTSDEIAEEKLLINETAIKDKIIVLVDDSIFGATQIRDWIFKLLDNGAREVHVRIAVPPVRYPCIFDFPNRVNKKLIAVDHTEEEIRKIIGAKTLKFNTLETFLNAIISAQGEEVGAKNSLKPKDFCTYCFTGISPLT